MLALTALMLVWIFVRYMRCRYAPDGRPRSCGYVDAWSEAGKRIQLDEEDNRDDDADDHHRPPPGDPSMN
jgi:hypothetical protein